SDVKEGDVFVTSEYSSQFPAGIPVLKVTYASKETDILFYDITGKAISEMDNINYCLIMQPDETKTKLNFLLHK
ncbi:MAG: rod shape-determining protein MreC, partial [Ignavibacteria bacterium]